MSAKEYQFFVGTYSDPGVENIFHYEADFERRAFAKIASHTGSANPSYLLRSRKGVLYAVEELATGGFVSAYRVEGNSIRKLCRVSANGADPCHLELDEKEEFLFVSNYSSGSLAVFGLDGEGIIEGLLDLKAHHGSGVDPARQEAPHVHFARCRGDLVYACDLGLDTVFRYELDRKRRRLHGTARNLRLPGGSGPRHLCFGPGGDTLYVAAELTADVFFYRRRDGDFVLERTLGSLPDGVPAGNRVAAIKFSEDGRFLFVSNRGADSLTAFAVEPDGTLRVLDVASSGGKAPRDFSVFGEFLVVANQDSRQIAALRFDPAAMRFEDSGMRETVVDPVCVLRA